MAINNQVVVAMCCLKAAFSLSMTAMLVLALGAEAKLHIVPGALEFALPFSILEDACKIDKKFRAMEQRKFGKDSLIHVAVVGCGYSGVELAATLSERLQDTGILQDINVETTICPTAPAGKREAALKVLSSRKVQLLLGYFVCCIQRVIYVEASADANEIKEGKDIAECNSKKYLELQPAEKGYKVKFWNQIWCYEQLGPNHFFLNWNLMTNPMNFH